MPEVPVRTGAPIEVSDPAASARALELGFELAATPTALLDGDGRCVRMNAAAAALLGFAGTQSAGHSMASCVLPIEQALIEGAFGLLAGGEDKAALDLRLLRPDGRVVQARTSFSVLQRVDGRPHLLMLELEDRTALYETHNALRASEERLAFALDASSDGLWDWDMPTGDLVINAAWSRMLGYEPGELRASIETWQALTHPDDVATAFSQLEAHAKGERRQVEFEMRMRRKDGSWCWILNRAKIVARDAAGAPLRVVGTHTDISARREQDEALRRQASILETILSTIPIAIDIVSPEGHFEYINGACERILGWSLEEMQQMDILGAIYPDPEYRAKVITSIQQGSPDWNDWEVRTRDGRVLTMSWSNVHLPDGRVIGLGHDVTAERAAESERETLERQLQQAQKLESLGVLAGGIAHDFNNLLVGMLGNASLAEEALPPDAPARELIGEVRATAARAADLTRQLLAYAGKGRFVVEPVDLSHLVGEMASLLRAAISKQATLEQDLAVDLPRVEADATQLRQIVMNLITNASDAIGAGAGRIRLRTGAAPITPEFRQLAIGGESLGDGLHVFIEVEDDGVGMSEETLARIFDPFFTTKFTGRGLGLAATLGIVRSHRGAIAVRSAPGDGTTIRLVLPATGKAAAPRQHEPERSLEDFGASGPVLLADDETVVRRLAARALTKAGFDVTECGDGQEALDAVQARPGHWRLVVLDLTMPRLSGDDALRAMRALRPDLPAILCSGYTEEAIDQDLSRLPHVAFLQKPFTMSSLAAALQRALGATLIRAPR